MIFCVTNKTLATSAATHCISVYSGPTIGPNHRLVLISGFLLAITFLVITFIPAMFGDFFYLVWVALPFCIPSSYN